MTLCPECRQPFPECKICEDCGIFYDEQEYIVHDLYNYQARPLRLYNRLDHFKGSSKDGKENTFHPKFCTKSNMNSLSLVKRLLWT